MQWLREQFELNRGANTETIPAMEGMRGLAVALVFATHYVILSRPWLDTTGMAGAVSLAVDRGGRVGVDLFFILSGFLIYGALLRRARPYGRYVARRLQRVYPTFFAVFLLYVLLSVLMPAQSKIPEGTHDAALYLIGNALLLPGLWPVKAMNSVTWTLSYEMAFYLVIPLLIAALRLRDRTPRGRITTWLVVAAGILAICHATGGPIALVMFPVGMIVYDLVRADRWRLGGGVALAAGLVALLAAGATAHDGPWRTLRFTVIAVAFGLFCAGCFARPDGRLARALSWTPLRWFGNMSYSYYLIHGLALNALAWLAARVHPAAADHGLALHIALAPLAFVATLPPAIALYLAVERPLSLRRR